MQHKISKKAAAELTRLLRDKEYAAVLIEWANEKRTGPAAEFDDKALGQILTNKVWILEIDIQLFYEFGIGRTSIEILEERLADYQDMVRSWEKRNMAREVA